MTIVLLALFALALAAANGANDNAKGVATLLGSGVAEYRRAVWLATLSTLAGSIASLVLAQGLIAAFSGRGLVPDATATSLPFLVSVAAAAALTVALASALGMPISTTHALVGGLLGAGCAIDAGAVKFEVAARLLLLPLLVSPVLAMATSVAAALLVRPWRKASPAPEPCVCVTTPLAPGDATTLAAPAVVVGTLAEPACAAAELQLATGRTSWFDRFHYLSAAAVGFARGANDTPKMAALLLATGLSASGATLAIALAIAVGGWFGARRVAQTMARDITRIEHGDGFGANLVTALLVTVASRFGLPVSTTHVSCGALFGLAAVNRRGEWSTVSKILLAWVVTMPLASMLSFLIRWAWPE